MSGCVIIGGADIGNYEHIRSRLCKDDFVVCCDSGLKHMEALQAKPNLIVGDFDSHENPHLNVETIVLPCEKDDTDTVFAVKEAVKREFEDFLLIGVVGASGKLGDDRFEMMSRNCDAEQRQLETEAISLRQEIEVQERQNENMERFIQTAENMWI